jgi:hypothetical protein
VAGTAGGSDPVWSPDGQWLLFAKPFGACGYGIYKVSAGGGTPVAVRTVANKYAVSPEFSRDGTQLFWGEGDLPCAPPSNLTPRSFVWVANADGSGPQQAFTNSTHDEYSPTVAGGTPLALETNVPTAPVVNAVGTVAATSATISWTGTPDSTEFVVRRVAHGDPAPATPADGTLVYQGAAHSATATGLLSGTAYDLYVWAYDASGNQSAAPSSVHAVRPYAPPTITPIGLVSTLTPSTSFPVYWNGTTPTFEVSVGEKTKNSAGYWTTNPTYHVVKTTAGKSMAFPGVQGHTYYLRVRGQDGFGNVTGYAATTAIVPLDENAALYTAGWTPGTGATRWMNSFRGATVAGKSMSLTTDTSSFRVIGDRCPSCGSFKVYVDGVLKATVSSYATTTKVRQVLWTSTAFTSVKSHRIQVVVSGTAGHPRVDLDGFGITR